MERGRRKSRPSVEGLEGRQLLSVTQLTPGSAVTTASVSRTEFQYTTPQGSKVDVKIQGGGNLVGSSLDSAGDLNLVYTGTTVFSTIQGTVKGGTGQANLATVSNASVPLDSTTGLGGELLGRVLLPQFNLIGGGVVNLTSGVQVFSLNSVSPNSQVHLRDTPLDTSLGLPSQGYVNTVTGAGLGYAKLSETSTGATTSSASGLSSGSSIGVATGQSAGGVQTLGAGTLNPTAVGFGGGSVGAINGEIPIIATVGNGQNFLGQPGLGQTQVSQGRNLSYVTDAAGGSRLSTIEGTFIPGVNLIEPSDISLPPHRVPPPGVVITINHVSGQSASSSPLGDAQIYGYDATTNSLIRFDAANGAALQSIPLPASASGVGGISLGRDGAEQVVLVGIGQEVLAYDATSGAPVGGFSIANLAATGFTALTGITTGDSSTTVLEDSADGPTGTLQQVNLAQSLATGSAVALGSAYSPAREFALAGTVTGVPGQGNVYALGSAFLDTTQPNAKQAGILTVTPSGTGLAENARTALTANGLDLPAGPNNGVAANTSIALGSLNSFLALDTGAVNGVNVVNLYTPNGLTKEGSFTLDDANSLADLSQSFHPELTDTALIDVQGNIQSFTAKSLTDAVLNVAGNFNQLTVNNASNSTVIGEPFSHVNIARRVNVTITTNSRLVGTRNGVTVDPSLKQIGPLSLTS